MIPPPAESHVLIRERTYVISGRLSQHSLLELVDVLHLEHSTGKLTINLSQGSVQSVQFEERARVRST